MNKSAYIAEISYQTENLLYAGEENEDIREKIEKAQEEGTFPSNLEFIDAYYDSFFGSSGCAFLDTTTGETIIGFAGTNRDNGWEQTGNDIIADAAIAFTGIGSKWPYMKEANRFIEGLKEDGHNITQATGHSLGGALCTIAGINHNIPLIVTYNGAPLYGLPTAHLTGTTYSLDELYKNYDGQIIRFVSSEDWLNNRADEIHALYYGTKFMIDNGQGHDMEFFLEIYELSFIKEVIEKTLNLLGYLAVDINGNGLEDITLELEDLIPRNLFSIDGTYSGNGTTIEINPETLATLSANLTGVMINEDLAWMKDAVSKCQEKNLTIGKNKEVREQTLVENLAMVFDNAGLTKTLRDIEESHGGLVKYKSTIATLSSFDTYSITRNFDMWGSSGGRRWKLGNADFDESQLIKWVQNLKQTASLLNLEMKEEGFYNTFVGTYMGPVSIPVLNISYLANAIASVTNTFLNNAGTALKGTGLRLSMKDGIVESVSEVLEVELENIDELVLKIENLSEVASVIAENFTETDLSIQRKIKNNQSVTGLESKAVPKSYEAYLEENKIYDDVKDVLEAYDIQVEESVGKLTKSLATDYADIIHNVSNKISSLYSRLDPFIDAANQLSANMHKEITSTKYVRIMNEMREWELKEEKYNHGTLSSFFTSDVRNAIETAKNNINSKLEILLSTTQTIRYFDQELAYVQSNLSGIIEQGIYNALELGTIINAQMLVSLRVRKLIEEISRVMNNLEVENQGQALDSYRDMLEQTSQLFGYFDTMVHDSFGENT